MNTRPFLTSLVLLAACGGDSGIGPPSPGAFGQADVSPECGAFHQACISRGLDSPLAVGSQVGLGISFEVPGSSGPPTSLASTDLSILTVEDGVATIVGEGVAALLITGPDETVVDFIHLWSKAADDIRVIRYNADGAPIGGVRDGGAILVGDELLVATEAFAVSQPLIGLFDTTWTAEPLIDNDPDAGPIASVVQDVVFGLYRIVARRPGTIRLTADALGQSISIDLEVLP